MQYLSDQQGNTTAVVIPIEDWNIMKSNFPSLDNFQKELPQWQKNILDQRLSEINNPDFFEPIDELFKVIDSDV